MARYYNNSYFQYLSLPPLHLCFFGVILFFFLGFSWYISYESIFEDFIDQMKLVLMASPLILLVIVHFLSSRETQFFIPLPERDSLHRAGGSPWGVAALLVFLFYMISYQSSFKEKWFPLVSRS